MDVERKFSNLIEKFGITVKFIFRTKDIDELKPRFSTFEETIVEKKCLIGSFDEKNSETAFGRAEPNKIKLILNAYDYNDIKDASLFEIFGRRYSIENISIIPTFENFSRVVVIGVVK